MAKETMADNGRAGGDRKRSTGTRRGRRGRGAVVVAALLMPVGILAVPGTATATTTPSTVTCGSSSIPGDLSGGTYSSVTVAGECAVSAGQVVVTGNVTVDPGAALIAAFATDAKAPGTSGLTVDGDISVGSGGTLILGCEAAAFACFDDPNQNSPTLNSPATVKGSVTATDPLGVIVHLATIGGDAVQTGGGGGVSCTPTGVFADFHSPAYSDYEDNTIGGNLRITGLSTCWDGALRNKVGGSITFSDNTMADPDASEMLNNRAGGNLLCSDNSPAIQYGDSHASPNVVAGFATGECAFGVKQPSPTAVPGPGGSPAGPLTPISTPTPGVPGYWLTATDGGVFSFNVPFLGSQSGLADEPVVGMATVPGGLGYDLAGAGGVVYQHGTAATDCPGLTATLNKPIVGIAAAPGGNGCWTAAADGGVFAFGTNAPFYGSAGGLTLNQPIVGIAAAPGNDGYYLVASDGGVFAYGPGATFHGSMGGVHLNQPVVGMAVDPATGGYWLVARDGGIFSFDAPFLGSLGSTALNQPVVGMAASATGTGYYLVAADGGVFAFGSGAEFQGSTGDLRLVKPVVGMSLG